MFLRRRIKELEEANKMCDKGFNDVHADMSNVIRDLQEMYSQFTELRDELATNGVVRDIRQVKRELKALQDDYYQFRQELDSNGVATAINKLRTEVFGKRKAKKNNSLTAMMMSVYSGEPVQPEEEATLAGKVDAIIEHLGLDVTVKPEEVSEAKVVAKRKVTKKKGRR